MTKLFEDKRSQFVSKSRIADREKDGRTRFEKRTKSKIAASNREYNKIDMNKLFKDHILTVSLPVHGETNDYLVKISFGGLIDALQEKLEKNNDILDLKTVIRAIIECFNKEDIYMSCTCPDFQYSQAYYMTKNGLNSGAPETRPSKETNPQDTKGSGCKHILLVLNNTSWVMKVASVIRNYVNYIEKHYQKAYADVIYPALYNRSYEEPVQLSLEDEEDVSDTEQDIDKSNEYARTKNQWTSDTAPRFISKEETDDEPPLFQQ